MSRIGKKTIEIPAGVELKIDDNLVTVKGPKGELQRKIRSKVTLKKEDSNLIVSIKSPDLLSKSLWGLSRTLINNMIIGVTTGFEKKLEFTGVGYRAQVEKKDNRDKLILNIGFSHPVEIIAPENINFKVEKNVITISGIDKEEVGQVASRIRKVRPPEPYKGKGIKYIDEHIRRKEGKAVAKAEGEE